MPISANRATANRPAILVDSVQDEAWHAAMQPFCDLHFEQTAIFGAGQRGERSSHVLSSQFGARVALYTVPVIGGGMALVRFGPFWRRADAPAEKQHYVAAIEALVDEYCRRRKLYLIVRPRAHPETYPMEAQALKELGILPGKTTFLDRYFVDVSLPENEQLASLDKRWRYNLKAGIAHDLKVTVSDGADAVSIFQRIYAEMVRRKHLNYPGVELVDFLPQLMALPSRMKARICLAYKGDDPVAGAVFSVNGDLAYYVFGASSDAATEMQAGHVLQWAIIRWLRENTPIRWYELGGPGDPGIRTFKKGLAGKRGALLPIEEFHYCTSLTARATVAGLYALRDVRNRYQSWRRRR